MSGSLAILAVGHGDTKLSFDPANPKERERSAKIVADMIASGYVILIEAGKDDEGHPLYRRAKGFDPAVCEYIVAGDPIETTTTGEPAHEQEQASAPRKGRKGASRRTSTNHRLPAERTKAVAVARTAGG